MILERFLSFDVTANSNPIEYLVPPRQLNTLVALQPGGGGTMTIKYKDHPQGPLLDGTLVGVSVYSKDVVIGPIYALYFYAYTSNGKVLITQW